ncbi:Polygalacturonate 4-alpha-galacturonosyltransferase [Acorus calamus]|uniref:Polygalacturonate 4-alpha-galacturonosyltransferase n=1 Tax=Acorus calamus TaxID=4465 RepID=A0AAV9DWS0_ACOCL|nr:Polygalacturonate 4-alpha-galacturonosyltransferase [Acorus calamus]
MADDNRAPPVSVFQKALLTFKRIHDMSSSERKIRESQHAIGEANSDAELKNDSVSKKVKAMGDLLSSAMDKLCDCPLMAKKLRAMVQSAEENIHAVKWTPLH